MEIVTKYQIMHIVSYNSCDIIKDIIVYANAFLLATMVQII